MKKKKPRGRFPVIPAAMVLCLAIFLFSVFRIVAMVRERNVNREANQQLAELAVVQPPVKEEAAPAEEADAEDAAQAQPERPAVVMPIEVDFELLKQKNEDIVAWLYCPDTPIHYPVVQGQDNEFYLKHMVDGQWNAGGSIFLDYRSSADMTDGYSLIHGHNLNDAAMFGTLPNYADPAYYEAHKLLYLLTPGKNFVIELFAGFVTDSDDGLYRLPLTAQRVQSLVETSIARSDFSSELRPGEDERLIALSTCSYTHNDARYVVIGVLREN